MSRQFGTYRAPRDRRTRFIALFTSMFSLSLSLLIYVVYSFSAIDTQIEAPIIIEHDPKLQMSEVLVPIVSVDAGVPLQPSMFRIELRPASYVSPNTIKSFEEIKGYFSKADLVRGHPFFDAHITQKLPISAISRNIPEGFRAIAIKVDETCSVEGWTQPGSLVDVFWITKGRAGPMLKTLVESAKVLSVKGDTKVESPSVRGIPTTVSLLVTREKSMSVALARSNGNVCLVLRGDDDFQATEGPSEVTWNTLISGGNEQPLPDDYQGTVTMSGRTYKIRNGRITQELI